MTTKQTSLQQPVNLAVALNATSPTGATGAVLWSTTTNSLLAWDGSKWAAVGGSSVSFAVGSIVNGPSAPSDGGTWLACDGSNKSQSTYSGLYSAIGHNYFRYQVGTFKTALTAPATGSVPIWTGATHGWAYFTASNIVYSTDNSTWTSVAHGQTSPTAMFSDGAGNIILIASGSATARYSTDSGSTWANVTLPASGAWNLKWNGTNWLGIKQGSGTLITSTSVAGTWSNATATISGNATNVLGWDGTYWIVPNYDGGINYTSSSSAATSWTTTSPTAGTNQFTIQTGNTSTPQSSCSGISNGKLMLWKPALDGSLYAITSTTHGTSQSEKLNLLSKPTNLITPVTTATLEGPSIAWNGWCYVMIAVSGVTGYIYGLGVVTSVDGLTAYDSALLLNLGNTAATAMAIVAGDTSHLSSSCYDTSTGNCLLAIANSLTGIAGSNGVSIFKLTPIHNVSTEFCVPYILGSWIKAS